MTLQFRKMYRVLRNVRNGRSPYCGLPRHFMRFSLRECCRIGLIDSSCRITEAGRAALKEQSK